MDRTYHIYATDEKVKDKAVLLQAQRVPGS